MRRTVVPEQRAPELFRTGDLVMDMRKRERHPNGSFSYILISRFERPRPRSYFAPPGHPDREVLISEPAWHAIYGPGEGKVAGRSTDISLRRLKHLWWCGNVDMQPYYLDLPKLGDVASEG